MLDAYAPRHRIVDRPARSPKSPSRWSCSPTPRRSPRRSQARRGPDRSPAGLGLLLTIAAAGSLPRSSFPELPLATALLIGAILAPTDAALGLPVVANPAVPVRIRRVLNVESGLNDGIATPFVLLLSRSRQPTDGLGGPPPRATRSSRSPSPRRRLGSGRRRLSSVMADRRMLTSGLSRQIAVLALALGRTCSVALGGNGFIAAFVGGLAFGAATRGGGRRRGVQRGGRDPPVDRRLDRLRCAFVGSLFRESRTAADPLRDPQPDRHPDGARRDRPAAPASRCRPSGSSAGSGRAAWPRSSSGSRRRGLDEAARRPARSPARRLDRPALGRRPRPVGRPPRCPLWPVDRDAPANETSRCPSSRTDPSSARAHARPGSAARKLLHRRPGRRLSPIGGRQNTRRSASYKGSELPTRTMIGLRNRNGCRLFWAGVHLTGRSR